MTKAILEQALDALVGYRREMRLMLGDEESQPCDAEQAIRAHLDQSQGEPVAAAGEDLAIYQSIADNYFKSIRPAHTEAEVQSILCNRRAEFGEYEAHVRRILGVPAP